MQTIIRLFTAHPHGVGESYVGHFCFALWFAAWLAVAALAALAHALFPFLFEKSASQIVARLYDRTKNRAPETRPVPELEKA